MGYKMNSNIQMSEISKILEEIKYGVDNSNIMTVQSCARFTNAMHQYMIDYPQKFEKDIEDFKNGLDLDSLKSLNCWIFQRKLDGKYTDYYRIPLSSGFFTEEQKIIYFTKFQIYNAIINDYKNKYDINDIDITLHAFYYNCGIVYLPSNIKEKFNNSIAIDGGAFTGDTAIMLYEKYNFKSIYSFEPVKKSYDIFNNCINKYKLNDKIKLFKYALSDKNEKKIIEGEYSDASILMLNKTNQAKEEIETIRLDDFFENETDNISLIKLDIEGYEEQALFGAEKIIKKFKPVLLISCYHDHTALGQMFRLKRLIENFNLGYKILFRQLEIENVLEYSLICYCNK